MGLPNPHKRPWTLRDREPVHIYILDLAQCPVGVGAVQRMLEWMNEWMGDFWEDLRWFPLKMKLFIFSFSFSLQLRNYFCLFRTNVMELSFWGDLYTTWNFFLSQAMRTNVQISVEELLKWKIKELFINNFFIKVKRSAWFQKICLVSSCWRTEKSFTGSDRWSAWCGLN